MSALQAWTELVASVNGRTLPPFLGQVGVRDPDGPCEMFDGQHYDGRGDCTSDGHYLCVECSHLSPEAPRFHNDRAGRADRLRLFWSRPSAESASTSRLRLAAKRVHELFVAEADVGSTLAFEDAMRELESALVAQMPGDPGEKP